MTSPPIQVELEFPGAPSLAAEVRRVLLSILSGPVQPSALELLAEIERQLGAKARWDVEDVMHAILADGSLPWLVRDYLQSVLISGDLAAALRGHGAPRKEVVSSIDVLLQRSRDYRNSARFSEVIHFMAKFREYSPYNNMLVRVQNPACSFFATETHWWKKFRATPKEDARPLVILAPKHPVLLVYDLDQVDGAPLPEELERFATFEGEWDDEWLEVAVENAARRDRIRVDFKALSSSLAGFATITPGSAKWKRRIAIHQQLDGPSKFGVLCHELAHIYLGHLGSDDDNWWPSRVNLTRNAIEVEAEAVAFLVTKRFGLQGSSTAYVSRHMRNGEVPVGVSLDWIAKVAGRVEHMARGKLLPRG